MMGFRTIPPGRTDLWVLVVVAWGALLGDLSYLLCTGIPGTVFPASHWFCSTLKWINHSVYQMFLPWLTAGR
jgi:hypothetical protein